MLVVTCVLTISLYAQSPTFGIKCGVNIATLNSGNLGAKIAYHVGALSRIRLTSKLSIQPEVLYSRQGIRQSLSGNNYDINLVYTNVPLITQLLLTTGLMLEAGPQFGFLLSAKNIYQGVEKDIKSNYKSFDLSFPIGLSYIWESGFGVYGRWVHGLTQINITYGSSKNSVLQFGLFYQLTKRNKK